MFSSIILLDDLVDTAVLFYATSYVVPVVEVSSTLHRVIGILVREFHSSQRLSTPTRAPTSISDPDYSFQVLLISTHDLASMSGSDSSQGHSNFTLSPTLLSRHPVLALSSCQVSSKSRLSNVGYLPGVILLVNVTHIIQLMRDASFPPSPTTAPILTNLVLSCLSHLSTTFSLPTTMKTSFSLLPKPTRGTDHRCDENRSIFIAPMKIELDERALIRVKALGLTKNCCRRF
jgi:hypothetical protein